MLRSLSLAVVCTLVGLVGSTALAADAPDLSTPKKAASAFAKAVEANNIDAAKSASVGSDEDYKLVQAIGAFIASARELRDASVAQFGEAGKGISNDELSNLSKQVEASDEKITGDTATLGKPEEHDPMKLKKVDGNWKVDLASIPDKDQMGKALPKMQKVMTTAATEIKSGKYKNVDEAKQAIGQQMFAVVAEQLNPDAAKGSKTAPAVKPQGGDEKK